MLLSSKLFENAIQTDQEGLIVDLSLKQLINLKGVERFLEPNEVQKLLLSTNYIPTLDQNFYLFTNLRELDISINHISRIENLESLQNLRLLNLANNRISKIENLEALKSLEVLDLSMNYIERIENLKNKSLKTLILSGNNISDIENLHHLRKLQTFEVEKNRIESIANIATYGFRELRKIVFAYNKIPLESFDDLFMTIEAIPTLEEINFLGNEVTLRKEYKAKVMQYKNIRVLDKLELKGSTKKHFENLRQENEIKDLVGKTRQEYIDRLNVEAKLKEATLEMIEKQKRQVEQLFDEHRNIMEDDMRYFYDRVNEFKDRQAKGLDNAITEDVLNNWKDSIKKSETEKKAALEEALNKREVQQRAYLDTELNSKKFTEKLYEISMKNPAIWRDIKQKEQEQYMQEEEQMNNAKKLNPNADQSELADYQDLANQIKANMIKDVANAVIDYEAKELHEQREKAANVLKHALLKQMVNHYGSLRNNNINTEESEIPSRHDDTNKKMNNTDDQLRDMLHSRVYKDGQWKNVEKPREGPKDLSNQSLGDLLQLEKAMKQEKATTGKKSPKKKKNKGQKDAIPEEEGDDEGHGRRSLTKPRTNQVSPNFERNGISPINGHGVSPNLPGSDDLERDPFHPDGPTVYDERHVVAEKNGEKIILIPFHENTNVLDGISGLDQPVKKRESKAPTQVQRQKTKGKQQNNMDSILKSLESVDKEPYSPVEQNQMPPIPDYQLRNKPYSTTKKEDKKPQRNQWDFEEARQPHNQWDLEDNQEEDERDNRRGAEEKKPQKSRACNIF